MFLRPLLRRIVPTGIRWRVRAARRYADDARSRTRLAHRRAEPGAFPHLVTRYQRPVICYPGQESAFQGKRHNVELAARNIDRLLIEPSETFSFWSCVGRTTEGSGYRPAAAIKDSVLIEEVGGAICLVSTVLYNIGLLSGMTIVERRCHSVDSYGEDRYFELGRDAAVEFAFVDLRFRNDWHIPLLLRVHTHDDGLIAEARAASLLPAAVTVEVEPPTYQIQATVSTFDPHLPPGSSVTDSPGVTGVRVRTRRTVAFGGRTRTDDLGISLHSAQPRRERIGPPQTSPRLRRHSPIPCYNDGLNRQSR